jgi:hypothetical protein
MSAKSGQRVTVIAGFLTLALLTAVSIVPTSASAAPPTQTVFVDEGFVDVTAGPNYLLPNAPIGFNSACLTAGTDTAQTPIPGCGGIDAPGAGALRLTSDGQAQEGGVGSTQSVPITKGLDAVFNSYQYQDGSSGFGDGDGLGFYLAATDPLNPDVPSTIGIPGGALGYTAVPNGGHNGLAYGYLGVGLDVYGAYSDPAEDGTDCNGTPDGFHNGAPGFAANTVSVRGAGNGTAGYCVLSTATGLDGTLLGTTRADSIVPVEVLINPSNSPSLSSSGSNITVPAESYMVVFTPFGGTEHTLTGPLPSTLNGGIPAGLYPNSWIDPSTGYPYKLTYGWVGSTGGAVDIHEINNVRTQTVNGPVPTLSSTGTDTNGGMVAHNASDTLTIAPTVTTDGGSEDQPIQITATFPTGTTPTTATSSLWICSINTQTETCTYTPGATLPPGTTLPSLDLPFTADGAPAATSIPWVVASTDATAVTGSLPLTITTASSTVSASAATGSVGGSVAVSASVLPTDATGTVTFSDTTTSALICTATINAASATCNGTALAPASVHDVSVTYSGDSNYNTSSTTTTLSLSAGATSMTAQASPASILYNATSTLSVSGLPSDATGTITFSAGSTTLCTATLPLTDCVTATTLAVNVYTVTAVFSGDSNYISSTAPDIQLAVAQLTPTIGESVSPLTIAYGNSSVLAVTGLPTGATGTITFSGSGPITLCTATLPTTSCSSPTTLPVGTYPVTASYSGDSNVGPASSSTVSLDVTQAHPTLTESASVAVLAFGSTATLTTSGLPDGATGSIVFTGPGSVVLCTATLPATSCATSPNLAVGSYAVTAAYSGDPNVASAQVAGTITLQIEPAPVPAVSALPGTGLPALQIVGAGLIMLIAGLGALATSRRTNRRAETRPGV